MGARNGVYFDGRNGSPRERAYVTTQFDREEFVEIERAAGSQGQTVQEFIKTCTVLRLRQSDAINARRPVARVSLAKFSDRKNIHLVVTVFETKKRHLVTSGTNDRAIAESVAQRMRLLLQQMPISEALLELKVLSKEICLSQRIDQEGMHAKQISNRPAVLVANQKLNPAPSIRVWKFGHGRLGLRISIGNTQEVIMVPADQQHEAKKFAEKLAEILDCDESLRQQRIRQFRDVLRKRATAMRDSNRRKKLRAAGFLKVQSFQCGLNKLMSQLTAIGEYSEQPSM